MDAINDANLKRLNERFAGIRDRVRGVALRRYPGFYLYGRAGTSKTYTVRGMLDTLKASYHYADGHMTARGLFELLCERPTSLIVLDDVGSLFTDRVALQLLLAALGKQSTAKGGRIVKYRKKDDEKSVEFSGGIIAISNLSLQGGPLLEALKSRVHCMKFDPTDAELAALMRALATIGWPISGDRLLTPEETAEVTEFVIGESERLGVRLDMRVLLDKALPDYLQHRNQETESHWRDLVISTLSERATEATQKSPVLTAEQQREKERRIIAEIRQLGGSTDQQIEQWRSRTGKSQRSFFRRKHEVESFGYEPTSDSDDGNDDDAFPRLAE
jgi:hypothetical protein